MLIARPDCQLNQIDDDWMANFLEKVSIIHSLVFDSANYSRGSSEAICSIHADWINSRFVHRLKLRHLEVDVRGIKDVQLMLNCFRSLLSIKLNLNIGCNDAQQINRYAKTLMPNCSIVHNSEAIWVCMDQQLETCQVVSTE